MHELSLAESLVELVLESVPEGEQQRLIREVHVGVGRMAGVVADSLEFCFTTLIEQSPFPQARLVLTEIPLRLHCRDCQQEVVSERDDFLCPHCQAASTTVLSGMELQLQSIALTDVEA
ncbi:MAG: hydrogenase maturation nickel metallochaperone HypA [Planctomycetota bacterium]